jgi:DNA helicase-2/ATP-dependent DNA helicase PcrA
MKKGQEAFLMEKLARVWSAYQLAVFRDLAEGKGHTYVGAVAGSGKSTTLEEGLKHIPAGKTVLVCAFGKEIATAFSERLARVKDDVKAKVECSTLHSYGNRQLGRAFGRPEINADKTWMLLDELLEEAGHKARPSKQLASTVVKAVSLAKCTLAREGHDIEEIVFDYGLELDVDTDESAASSPFGDSWEDRLAWVVKTVLALLARSREVTKVIDFDDMIWLPVVLNVRVWQFDLVLVDETQDFNAAQLELALRACKQTGRIIAVGDEHQAIFAFRGADENAIPNLVSRLRAKRLNLSVSYRCAKSIIQEAQQFVPQIEWAEGAEEGQVLRADDEYMREHVQPGDFILSRSNAPLVAHCLAFLRDGRPAKILGKKDVAKTIKSLVEKAKTQNVGAMLSFVEKWAEREILHLQASDRPKDAQIELVTDKLETIKTLAEGAQSVNEVYAKIDSAFSDDGSANAIVLASTHKAKGLEAQTVWILRDTYLKRDEVEERNLMYVAITRAQKTLYYVRAKKTAGGVR